MVIETKNVFRTFETGTHSIQVLKGVDFSVDTHKMVVFMGPSGSGKTTLINQICLLDHPTKGEIYLFGERVDQLSEKERDEIRSKKLGIIFQSVALMSNMTAYENIDFFLRIAHYPKKERRERAEYCLKLVGLEKRMNHMPAQMSGGEQQRVAIARAFAHCPQIIFADEPTAQLDTEMSIHIMNLLKRLVDEEKITIIMTTHDPNMAVFGDETIHMRDGKVMQDGRG